MTRRAGGKRRGKPHRIVLHRAAGTTVELGHPEPLPLRALILNLDAAVTTGVAVYIDGRLRAYDQVNANDPHARRALVREAMRAAEVRGLPLALVTEAPWGGYVSAAVSLAGTVRLWRDTWLTLDCNVAHFIELTAGQWRRAILGKASIAREAVRRWEMLTARALVAGDMPGKRDRLGRVALERGFALGADAAAAICMGQVTSRSSGVRKRLQCDLTRPLTAATARKTNTV